jgi:predicted ATP-binding protein involved in virulence
MSKLPLFIITGASGVGKTTVIDELRYKLPNYIVFDVDSITDSNNDYGVIKNNWLRIAGNIAKSNVLTILCGTIMPWDIEKCDYYFSKVYYLNLHCNDEIRKQV